MWTELNRIARIGYQPGSFISIGDIGNDVHACLIQIHDQTVGGIDVVMEHLRGRWGQSYHFAGSHFFDTIHRTHGQDICCFGGYRVFLEQGRYLNLLFLYEVTMIRICGGHSKCLTLKSCLVSTRSRVARRPSPLLYIVLRTSFRSQYAFALCKKRLNVPATRILRDTSLVR